MLLQVCGTTVASVLKANPEIKNADGVRAGDCIEIPVKHVLPRFYVVQPGDTMALIAQRYDVSLMRLLKLNSGVKSTPNIQPGWVVSIPGLRGTSCEEVDAFGRTDLISASVDEGASLLFDMMGTRSSSLNEAISGDGSRNDQVSRLGRFSPTPPLSIEGEETPRIVQLETDDLATVSLRIQNSHGDSGHDRLPSISKPPEAVPTV